MKKLLVFGLLMIAMLFISACSSEANVASMNISRAADQFEINRRIVFYNGITGEYILVLEGLCSLGNFDTALRMSVTCKTGPTSFKKHFLGLSDNVTFFAEQIDVSTVDAFRYRVIFRPETILPAIEIELDD